MKQQSVDTSQAAVGDFTHFARNSVGVQQILKGTADLFNGIASHRSLAGIERHPLPKRPIKFRIGEPHKIVENAGQNILCFGDAKLRRQIVSAVGILERNRIERARLGQPLRRGLQIAECSGIADVQA